MQSEDKVIGPNGQLLNAAAQPNPASELFTTAFTKKYPDIASASPIFAQLRNMIDLSVVAAFLRAEDYYGRSGWDARLLLDESSLPTRAATSPRKAPCAVNSFWNGNRLFSAAGGGVSIMPVEALNPANVQTETDGKLTDRRTQVQTEIPADAWWWD